MQIIMTRGALSRLEAVRHRSRLTDALRSSPHVLTVVSWSEGEPAPDLGRTSDSAFLYGGHRFLDAVLEARPDLAPGIFLDPDATGHGAVTAALGGLCLNADARVAPLRDAMTRIAAGERLFLRPQRGDKSFAGGVFTSGDLHRMPTLPDEIVTGEVAGIVAEYRFVVADGEVITGSQYRRGGRMDVRIDTDPDAKALAQRAASLYAPLRMFICDVAETPQGFRVVEYNSFSAAGLYACDGTAIMRALEVIGHERERTTPCRP